MPTGDFPQAQTKQKTCKCGRWTFSEPEPHFMRHHWEDRMGLLGTPGSYGFCLDCNCKLGADGSYVEMVPASSLVYEGGGRYHLELPLVPPVKFKERESKPQFPTDEELNALFPPDPDVNYTDDAWDFWRTLWRKQNV